MSFFADNGRIWIKDQGQIVFDTETPMPSVSGIYDGVIEHVWASIGSGYSGVAERTYYGGFEYEAVIPLAPLQSDTDFVITQIELISDDPATAPWAGEWPMFIPEGKTFFQGSALVELLPSSEAQVFLRRLLHVYPDNQSGQLVAVFQHSSREHSERGNQQVKSAHLTRLRLKAWYGSF